EPIKSRGYTGAMKTFGGSVLAGIRERVDAEARFRLIWPSGLYIPSQANSRDYWAFGAPPAGNRYARQWTITPVGIANANAGDGSFYAACFSPPAPAA